MVTIRILEIFPLRLRFLGFFPELMVVDKAEKFLLMQKFDDSV